MKSVRIERINGEIQKAVSHIIDNEIKSLHKKYGNEVEIAAQPPKRKENDYGRASVQRHFYRPSDPL